MSSIVPDLDSTSNRDEDHVHQQLKSETRDRDGEQSHIKQFELLLLLEHESVKGFTVSAIDKCRGNPFIFAAAYAYRFRNKETRSIKQSEASHFDSDLKGGSTTVPKYNSTEEKICSTVPKMKTLFNSAENMNKFQYIKCGEAEQ